MRPQIFVPGDKVSLEDVGLAELEAGADRKEVIGPDGKRGLLFAWLDPQNKEFRYAEDEQRWLPASGHGGEPGRYYVGVWKDSPPTERELLRPDHRRGSFVPMGNGEQWLVTTPNHLDRFPYPQPDGSLKWVVDTSFNALTTQLDRLRATQVATGDDGARIITFDPESDFYFLCDVLSINYRLVPELVADLKLLSDQGIRELLATLLGLALMGD